MAISLVSGFLSYLIGGYVTARMSRYAGGKHAALTAVIGLIVGIIMAVILAFFETLFAEGAALPLAGFGLVGPALVPGLVLFLIDLFGGFVGGKLGEPSPADVRRSGWQTCHRSRIAGLDEATALALDGERGGWTALQSAKEMQRYSIHAAAGEIADVEAFYFDDESWKIRYLVAKTAGMLINPEVLITPEFIKKIDRSAQVLHTDLTKEQVKNAPGLEADRPVADQQEIAYYDYYGVAPYWGVGWDTASASVTYPGAYAPSTEPNGRGLLSRGDSHLRSTKEVTGYHIQATNGDIGRVEDFVVDEGEWTIRYVILDTRNWLPSKKVLVSSYWIPEISCSKREVYVDLIRDEIKSTPEWDPEAPLDREYETQLHEHYGRLPYWVYR